jgi:hypothetical protein
VWQLALVKFDDCYVSLCPDGEIKHVDPPSYNATCIADATARLPAVDAFSPAGAFAAALTSGEDAYAGGPLTSTAALTAARVLDSTGPGLRSQGVDAAVLLSTHSTQHVVMHAASLAAWTPLSLAGACAFVALLAARTWRCGSGSPAARRRRW